MSAVMPCSCKACSRPSASSGRLISTWIVPACPQQPSTRATSRGQGRPRRLQSRRRLPPYQQRRERELGVDRSGRCVCRTSFGYIRMQIGQKGALEGIKICFHWLPQMSLEGNGSNAREPGGFERGR